jgi:hypothetical protein
MGRSDLRPVILNEVKAEIFEQHLSAACARQELNWRPRHPWKAVWPRPSPGTAIIWARLPRPIAQLRLRARRST